MVTRRRVANPTQKQINYALYLLAKAGYNTRWMNASFKELGATMRERSGTVESWLWGMNHAEISSLIGTLLARTKNPRSSISRIPSRWTPARVTRLKTGQIQLRIGRR